MAAIFLFIVRGLYLLIHSHVGRSIQFCTAELIAEREVVALTTTTGVYARLILSYSAYIYCPTRIVSFITGLH